MYNGAVKARKAGKTKEITIIIIIITFYNDDDDCQS